MCFLDTKELFGLFLGFLQKSSKDHILVQKRQKLKKGEIKFLNGKYNVNQEKKNHVFKCSSQQPPFQMDPRASKTPVCGALVESFKPKIGKKSRDTVHLNLEPDQLGVS